MTWGRLTDLINNVKGLSYKDTLFFVFSQKDVQLFTIELNTGAPNIKDYGQLFLNGIDSEGVLLSDYGGEYSDLTVQIKKNTGLPFDRITLYQEGDFYNSWEFIQDEDGFKLRANTFKDAVDLQERWGYNLVGLTNESINELIKEIIPEIIDYILREILQ